MSRKFNLLRKFGVAIFVFFSIGFAGNLKVIAETVRVSAGGMYQGKIAVDRLNGKIICTYSNGDLCEGTFKDGQLNVNAVCDYKSGDEYQK